MFFRKGFVVLEWDLELSFLWLKVVSIVIGFLFCGLCVVSVIMLVCMEVRLLRWLEVKNVLFLLNMVLCVELVIIML